MLCRKCGAEMDQTEKDTSSGRDIREYLCRSCGHSDWEERGPALWQILHDDREAAEAEKAAAAAGNTRTEGQPRTASSFWHRLATRVAGTVRRRK